MFQFANPHPEGKRVGDCVKRACCLASEINYHDIALMLNRYRKVTGCKKFNSSDNWKQFVEEVLLGVKDDDDMRFAFEGHRYTVADFADCYVAHTCILRCSKHVVCTKNGDYYDTWDSGDKGVYIAYFLPKYEQIVNHIRKCYPTLCKGLTLKRI